MSQEKKKEEDLSVLKISVGAQYEDLRPTLKRAKKRNYSGQ